MKQAIGENFMCGNRSKQLGLGFLAIAGLLTSTIIAGAQQNTVTVFKKAEIDRLIKTPPSSYDRTLRVLDMGSYQLAVAVAMHEPTTKSAGAARPSAPRDPKAASCGAVKAPPGAKPGPRDGISHDDTTETYVMISGSGTLVTGGQIVNGTRSAPDSETSKYLAGPSCVGAMVGDLVMTKVGPGDVVVIPAGMPHGWIDVMEKVTYLTIRPDPKKILQHGYVNPAIK